MGIYLNPGNELFEMAVNSEIYVDKSMLITITNTLLRTNERHICISRPRRFGKSMAANMLTAYYSRGCDSEELFRDLEISGTPDFEKHLNKYDVIRLDVSNFVNEQTDPMKMCQKGKGNVNDKKRTGIRNHRPTEKRISGNTNAPKTYSR